MAEIEEEWVCVAYGERMGVWVREYRALKNISRRYTGRMGVWHRGKNGSVGQRIQSSQKFISRRYIGRKGVWHMGKNGSVSERKTNISQKSNSAIYRKNGCVTYGEEWECDIWGSMGVRHLGKNRECGVREEMHPPIEILLNGRDMGRMGELNGRDIGRMGELILQPPLERRTSRGACPRCTRRTKARRRRRP